eukprot:scaffold64100_cov54-Phaeocystis_antarctica.AAC.3
MHARLSATFEGTQPSPAASGAAAAAALAASLSAFSAASASRTSLVAAPRSGCCARSLASSGLKPRSGSATRSPRTASRRASDVQGSHMRGCASSKRPECHPPPCRTASLSLRHRGKTERPAVHLSFHSRRKRATPMRHTTVCDGVSSLPRLPLLPWATSSVHEGGCPPPRVQTLHAHCPAAASGCGTSKLGSHRRSTAQRRNPLVVRGRLIELRC